VWRVGGSWRSSWKYKKDDDEVNVFDALKVNQWGSFVFGKGSSLSGTPNAPFSSYRYNFQGVMNGEGLIEGKWQNLNPGRVYYGVFQLKVARSCKDVAGFWIGSASDGLNSGSWNSSRTSK
jgi:hypothetical protein